MSATIGNAINKALLSENALWRICCPSDDFHIYRLQKETGGSPPVSTAKLTKCSNREWTLSDGHALELAVVPVITGRYAWKKALTPGRVATLQYVLSAMRMPECTLSCFLDNRIQFNAFPGLTDADSREEAFILNFRQWAMAWHADKQRGLTKAVLLMMGGSWAQAEIGSYVERFLLLLAERAIDHETPGLLAVLLCARNIAVSLADLDESAFRTERRLRQVIEGAELSQEDELGKLSAAHSWLAARAIREKARLSAATAFLEHAMSSSAKGPQHQQQRNQIQDLGALQKMVHSLVGQASKLCEETTMHLSTIYNLIAQRDQATNLAIAAASREIALQSRLDQAVSVEIAEASKKIAEETRKDSNAMKMIALVTMLYLPGTFIATCFSMGIFEWSAKPSQVVSPRIWVYFLFTGVLTLLTIGLFVAMTYLQEKVADKGSTAEAGVISDPVQQSSQDRKEKEAAVFAERVSTHAHGHSVLSLAPSLSIRGNLTGERKRNFHQGPGISDRAAIPRSDSISAPTEQNPVSVARRVRSRSRSPARILPGEKSLYTYATSEPEGEASTKLDHAYRSDSGHDLEIPPSWHIPPSETSSYVSLHLINRSIGRQRGDDDDARSVVPSVVDRDWNQNLGGHRHVDDDSRSVVASIAIEDFQRVFGESKHTGDDARSVVARAVDRDGNIIH